MHVFVVLLLTAVAACQGGKIPSYISICHRSDPKLEQCILNSIDGLRSRLGTGIPELHVPPLEPLSLPLVQVALGAGFTATGRDVQVFGIGGFKVTAIKVDMNSLLFDVTLEVPVLYLGADYDINARLFNLPLKGRGPIKVNASDIRGDITLQGELRSKHFKGVPEKQQYLGFNKVTLGLHIGDFKIHVENLFSGDTILNEATNAAVNANSQEFLGAVRPVIERTVANVLLEIANNVTTQFTYDDIFPA